MSYDKENIFSKILTDQISCEKIYEDKEVLCFYDINPVSKVHALIIPKNNYISFDDFISSATDEEITNFFKVIKIIAKKLKINENGYRLISNHGKNANQEVPHFHFHLLGGEDLGGIK
tara:strand:+ start:179 stop:532 length:354 start_codon:yes stop_codon:yes gene_type:complete